MNRWIMRMAITCLVLVPLTLAFASGSDTPILAPGETAVVRVHYPNQTMGNKALISFEAQLLETDFGKGFHVMRVTQDDIDRLTAAGLKVVIDDSWIPSLAEEAVEEQGDYPSIPGYPCYRTVEATYETAADLLQQYPDLVEVRRQYGDSWEKTDFIPGVYKGFDMLVLSLTNQGTDTKQKPNLFITAAMHAREYATAELVTRFAEYLLENYGKDADVTWILDHHTIHLMLQTNPDGRKIAEDHTYWRKNTNRGYCEEDPDSRGADLNRNFTFGWNCCGGSSDDECSAVYHGAGPASEPEIQAVEAYMNSIFEKDQWAPETPENATGIYIDVHSYGKLVLWPWGSTSDLAPDAEELQTLGRKFAYWNDYSPEQAIGLYPTDGTSDEHAYGTYRVASYCFEIGTSFFQPCNAFEETILPDNLPALVYAAKVARTPYRTPKGPDARDLSISPDGNSGNRCYTLTAVMDDTRYKALNGNLDNEPVDDIAAAKYYIDTPPWEGGTGTDMAPADNNFNSPIETVTAKIVTGSLAAGRHIVFVQGEDAEGNLGAVSAIFLDI